jgi:hypothetical protein
VSALHDLLVTVQLVGLAFIAVCGAVSSVAGLVMLRRQSVMHVMMNSRLDQLVNETRNAARSAGEIAGRAAEASDAANKTNLPTGATA